MLYQIYANRSGGAQGLVGVVEGRWERITGSVTFFVQEETSAQVVVGRAKADRVPFTDHTDQREGSHSTDVLDGSLGLDFFAPFAVTADWQHDTLYLVRRGDLSAQASVRLTRWPNLAKCAPPGCVTMVIEPQEPEVVGVPQGVVLRVTRDSGTVTRWR